MVSIKSVPKVLILSITYLRSTVLVVSYDGSHFPAASDSGSRR
jgi:hypothetical protein